MTIEEWNNLDIGDKLIDTQGYICEIVLAPKYMPYDRVAVHPIEDGVVDPHTIHIYIREKVEIYEKRNYL